MSNAMNSGQSCRSCRGSCSPIPGRGCFGDFPGKEIVVSPQRGLALIGFASLTTRIQATEFFSGFSVPEVSSLSAETINWACDAYARTATLGCSRNRSPYEMFNGEPSQTCPIPSLKSGFCKYKRKINMGPKAKECSYPSPASNHPSESKRVLDHSRNVVVTRSVT